MRTLLSFVATASLICAVPASAVDEHHPEQQKGSSSQTAPKDVKPQPKQAPAAQKPSSASAQAGGMPMGMMAGMEKMQQQMQRLMQTQDPKDRDKLLKEHMQTMQEQMKMMSGMMGQGMMKDGGMAGGAKGGQGMPTDQRMQMMEQRMDMMQKMMDQMLKHQDQKTK